MEKLIGKIIEVYIPEEYKNNNLLDIMDRTKIGFKILVNNEIINIKQEQNDINSNLMKGDSVLITKQTISNQEFIDIEGAYDERI